MVAVDTGAIPKKDIMLFDGVCGLCHGVVQFILPRDRQDRFQFASLQSNFAETELNQYGKNNKDLDTFYVIAQYGTPAQRLLQKSDAALYVLSRLDGIFKAASVFKIIPRIIRDRAYDLVAKNRYKIFGKVDSCMMPTTSMKNRFIESEEVT